jgi:hypothetical protein
MATTALDLAPARVRAGTRGWTRLLAPLGGLGLVAGVIATLATPAGVDTGETAAEVVAVARSNEGWMIASALFGLFALAFVPAFVAGLHARLRDVATATEGALILIGGTVFGIAFTLCWVMWTAPLIDMPSDSASALAQAQAYLAFDDVGWFMFAAAGVAAAVMAVPASLAGIRAGLPAWLGWLGVAAGIASAGTVAFFGLFAWLAWIAVASIVLLVSPRS